MRFSTLTYFLNPFLKKAKFSQGLPSGIKLPKTMFHAILDTQNANRGQKSVSNFDVFK